MLDILFPNRCIRCSRIIDANFPVCNLCFEQIHFTHNDYSEDNFVKEKCSLLFPIENAFALMQFEKENVSRKLIHELKYGVGRKSGKL
jgi:predicted amidophosphoribosyltransferase